MGLIACLIFSQTQAASFDCAKAGTKVEKLICTDQQLSEMDNHLAEQYALALAKAQDKAALKIEQITWLKERNHCSDRECISQSYYQRLDTLGTLVAGRQSRYIDSARMFDMAKEGPVTLQLPDGGSITIEHGGEPPGTMAPNQYRETSIDCDKARSRVEKLICADLELSRKDLLLSELYAYAQRERDKATLQAEQQTWLKERDRCRNVACIDAAYEKRFAQLPAAAASPAPPANPSLVPPPVTASAKPAQPQAMAQPEKPVLKLPERPVRVFAREVDKAAAIGKILAGHTLHYSSPEGKEPPFCSRLQGALRAGQGVGFVEPEFTTQDVNDSRLARYRRCAIKEEEISSDFKIRYSPAVMIGTEAVLANLKLFRVDADNNPANGLEEFLYGEKTRDKGWFSRKASTAYTQLDLKSCKRLDGAPADWSSPLADGLSAIIRFENRYYILSMSIFEEGSFSVGISNLRANKKHKWDATACAWSTFPYFK